MKVQVIASSSAGNSMAVWSHGDCLLLEAGIPIDKIRQAVNGFSHVECCLVTHEHEDHSSSVARMIKAGVDVYMSDGTRGALGTQYAKVLKQDQMTTIGRWIIVPFRTAHDAAQPFGYYISDGQDNLLFATDTYWIPYTFGNITIMAIECNYQSELLKTNVANGIVHPVQAKRILRSHMSLDHLVDFLAQQDLKAVREIWLLHMSSNNINPDEAVKTIQAATGKPVYAGGIDNG